MNFISKLRPLHIAILYILLIFIFGIIYWLNPIFWANPLNLIESFYFSIITITTLGYGDIIPP